MLLALAVVAAPAAIGQEVQARVDAKRDWSVFVAEDPKECWIVSAPTDSSAERGGRSVSVNRGEIMLMVGIRPDSDVANEVAFTGGYPFRPDSTVNLAIGTNRFELFTENNGDEGWAWPASPEEDTRIVTAMRRGVTATLTGLSNRGTTTTDTVSLLGFTAALERAQELCS
ncbi:MAG: invasion associated locus B family protein [Pseudomonadota bacterium]